MFIALIGPRCSGKSTVANYLVTKHDFTRIYLVDPPPSTVSSHDPSSSSFPSSSSTTTELIFHDTKTMLEYVTDRWQSHFVTLDLTTDSHLEPFIKRPFALLVAIYAPPVTRYHRSLQQQPNQQQQDLESFLLEEEVKTNQLFDLSNSISLQLRNPFTSHIELETYLDGIDLTSSHRLRPCWDSYFVSLCSLASLRSNCMKRRVGAVLVRSNRVLSTGYNGTPSGLLNCNQGGCPRCNHASVSSCGQNLDECLCLHAEENALLEAGRDRGGAKGTVIYCNTCPCLRCAVKIVQTGVKEVVYQQEYSMDDRSARIFTDAGIVFRKYIPPV